uniref:POPDC1-3 domain-containing protein n=1 Tax=Tetranychus urticae TaxID=32264 RepID=T1KNJ8_TETUR
MNTTDTFLSKAESSLRNCKSWFGSNDPLFSLFQTVILLAFSVPANFNIARFIHKVVLFIGYGIGLIWAATRSINGWNSDFRSLLTWYGLFLVINGSQLINMLIQRFLNQIPRHLLDLYTSTFQPLGVTPRDFLDLTKFGTILNLYSNETYAVEGSTKLGEKISILLSGKLRVTFSKTFLYEIEPNRFIDPFEFKFLKYPKANVYQVTISADEPCKLLTWSTSSFVEFLDSRERLKCVVDACIGKDIIHKLYGS